MTSNSEQQSVETAGVQDRKPSRKAGARAPKPHVAPSRTKKGKKATGARKAKAGQGKAARQGSKTEKVLSLLKRSGGATLKELMNATGWQAHSVRGFLSGTVGKKLGLELTSVKGDNGERTYSLKA